MDINPQYTFDNAGNPVGVFLPIEEWKQLSQKLDLEIPDWQKEKVLHEKLKMDSNPSLLVEWESARQQLIKQ